MGAVKSYINSGDKTAVGLSGTIPETRLLASGVPRSSPKNTMATKEYKALFVKADTHRKVVVEAHKRGLTIDELELELLKLSDLLKYIDGRTKDN